MASQENVLNLVHPVVRSLEQENGSAVILHGYLGSSAVEDEFICLYPDLDTSVMLEIPKKRVLHMQEDPGTEPKTCSVYVMSDAIIRQVESFSFKASEFQPLETRRLPPQFPPLSKRDFWTCAQQCIFELETAAVSYNSMLARALAERNPDRQQLLQNRAEEIRARAIEISLVCLNDCDSKYPNGHPGLSLGSIHQYHVQRVLPS